MEIVPAACMSIYAATKLAPDKKTKQLARGVQNRICCQNTVMF
jgi:hypothetical protein